jgi:hypothetical protein
MYKTYYDNHLDKKIKYKNNLYLIELSKLINLDAIKIQNNSKEKKIKGSSSINDYSLITNNKTANYIFLNILNEYYKNASSIIFELYSENIINYDQIIKNGIPLDKTEKVYKNIDKKNNMPYIKPVVYYTNINYILEQIKINKLITLDNYVYIENTDELLKYKNLHDFIIIKLYDDTSIILPIIIKLFNMLYDKKQVEDKLTNYKLIYNFTNNPYNLINYQILLFEKKNKIKK